MTKISIEVFVCQEKNFSVSTKTSHKGSAIYDFVPRHSRIDSQSVEVDPPSPEEAKTEVRDLINGFFLQLFCQGAPQSRIMSRKRQ